MDLSWYTGKHGVKLAASAGPEQTLDEKLSDLGPTGLAAKRGTVVESVNDGGLKRKRRRRVPLYETMRKRGELDARQHDAAEVILAAWCGTLKSPPAIHEIYVDSWPDPARQALMHCERQGRWIAVSQHVPRWGRCIVGHVVLANRPLSALPGSPRGGALKRQADRLREALTHAANGLAL